MLSESAVFPNGVVKKDNILPDGGHIVIQDVIPLELITRIKRRLLFEIVRMGLFVEDIAQFHQEKCWWPSMREEPIFAELINWLPSGLVTKDICEPQLLLHFPDEAEEWPMTPHIDEVPEWANGRTYHSIVGIPLTPWNSYNGGIGFNNYNPSWVKDEWYHPPLEPGDIVAFGPLAEHSGTLNKSGDIRMGVYWRFLKENNVEAS